MQFYKILVFVVYFINVTLVVLITDLQRGERNVANHYLLAHSLNSAPTRAARFLVTNRRRSSPHIQHRSLSL